jgi:hypothetical protein
MRISLKKEPTPIEDNALLADIQEEVNRLVRETSGEPETLDHFLDGEEYEINLA